MDLDWHYDGDVNIREGGFFWRNDAYDENQARVVQVVPSKDSGGPDNLFRILVGLVDFSDDNRLASALSMSGLDPSTASRGEIVAAAVNAHGVEPDEDYYVRIGKPDPYHDPRPSDPEPETVLRSNTSLRKWITREYLHREPLPASSLPAP